MLDLFFGRCMLGLEMKLAAPLLLRGIAGLQEGRVGEGLVFWTAGCHDVGGRIS